MDLLGRKSKEQFEQERLLTAQLVSAGEQLLAQRDELLRIATEQRDAIAELSASIQSREALIADLMDENAGLAAKQPKAASKPIHLSEEEQELQWQLENKLISVSDYENILKELEFQNTEIEIDPDYRPRPDLTY